MLLAICATRAGCQITATSAAISAARKSTTIAGQRRAIMIPVSTGTSSIQGEMRNVSFNSSRKATFPLPETSIIRPATVKITSEMQNVGIVVVIMKRICVNSGVPETLEAKTVVSDSGESLSPK